MARIFITGSTDGLGRAAARTLLDDGRRVVLHARTPARAASVDDLAVRAADVVVGDLASAEETGRVADQVNAIGRVDAVIHNAAAYIDAARRHSRGARAHSGRKCTGAVRADRHDRPPNQAGLHGQRHAP
jgi:NAD(P)-dependent dehydrogenase (short-subunit alcohol dehydrogenase family)